MVSKLCKPSNLLAHSGAVSHSGFPALCGLFHVEGQPIEAKTCLAPWFISYLVSTISSVWLVLIFLLPPKYHTFYIFLNWRVPFVISCQHKIFYVEKDKNIRTFLDLPKWVKPSQKENYQPSPDSDVQIPWNHAAPLKVISYSTWSIATGKSVCWGWGVSWETEPTCKIKKNMDLIHWRVL